MLSYLKSAEGLLCFEFHDCLDLSWVWFDAILTEGVANVTDLLDFVFV